MAQNEQDPSLNRPSYPEIDATVNLLQRLSATHNILREGTQAKLPDVLATLDSVREELRTFAIRNGLQVESFLIPSTPSEQPQKGRFRRSMQRVFGKLKEIATPSVEFDTLGKELSIPSGTGWR